MMLPGALIMTHPHDIAMQEQDQRTGCGGTQMRSGTAKTHAIIAQARGRMSRMIASPGLPCSNAAQLIMLATTVCMNSILN